MTPYKLMKRAKTTDKIRQERLNKIVADAFNDSIKEYNKPWNRFKRWLKKLIKF